MSELHPGLREAIAEGLQQQTKTVDDVMASLTEIRDDNRRHNKDAITKLDAIIKQLQSLNNASKRFYSGS